MTTASTTEPRASLLLALLVALVGVVYAPTLTAPLVWDDSRLILESPAIEQLDLRHAFLTPFWFGAPGEAGSSAFFRPITSLSLGLDYRIHAQNPAGYHLSNVVFHLIGVGALFALLRRRGASARIAFLLGLGWALLPRLTEGVAWISGRGDVLGGMFSLLALLCYRQGSPRRVVLAAVLALAALFSKESGLGVWVALSMFELGALRASPRRAKAWLGLGTLGAVLLIYGGLRINAGATAGEGLHFSLAARALACIEALGRYAFMLVDPLQPRTLMGRIGKAAWGYVAVGGVVVVGLGVLARRLSRVGFETRAYLVLGLLPLALVIHLIRLPVTVVASDRYLYVPTLGLLLAAAPAFERWARLQRWVVPAWLVLLLLCGVRTALRVADYTEVARFWAAAARGAPHEAMPLVELGSAAYRAGLFSEARALYAEALTRNDWSSPRALENAALLATTTGERERAARLGDEMLRRFPGVASLELRRATIALSSLDFELARRHGVRAVELDPSFGQARGFLRMLSEVRDVWQRVEAGELPLAARLGVEMRALRYPELVVTLTQLLDTADADDGTLRRGLDFVLRVGSAEDAERLFARYFTRHAPADREQLADVARRRIETARSLRGRLRELRH